MRVTSSAAVPSASTVSEPAARHSSVNSPKMPSVGGCDCAPVAPPSAPGAGGNGARKSAGGCVAANDASDLAPSTSASSPAPRAAHATASFAGRNAPLSAEAHRAKCARRVVSPGSSAPLGKTSPDIAHSDANADRVAAAVAATAPTPEDSPRTRALVVAWRVKSQSSAPGARSGSRHAGPGAIFAATSSSPPPRADPGPGPANPNPPEAAPAPFPPREKSHARAVHMSRRAATQTPSSAPASAAPDSATDLATPAPCEKNWRRKSVSRLARQRSWKSHGRFMGDAVVGENSAMTTVKSCSPVRRAAVVEACATAASASASMAPRSASGSSHARLRRTARVLRSWEATTGGGGGTW